MLYWIVYLCLCGTRTVLASIDYGNHEGRCGEARCAGEEYECIDDRCYCASGYIPNHFHVRCVKCPGLNENCFGQCCNPHGNDTLTCWHGVCKPCLDDYGNFICNNNMKEVLLVSSAQLAMGAALVLGIIATFILLYKLCAATNIRPMGERGNSHSRVSIGSLQLYIEERLRDAPPRYTRGPAAAAGAAAAAAGSRVCPLTTHINHAYINDMNVPPPPYVEVVKTEDQQNTALHI